MFEKKQTVKRTRYAILLAIVIAICLLLLDCAHSLRSTWDNGFTTLPPVNQQSPESAVPKRTDAPLLAAKEETALPTDTGRVRSEAFPKDGQRQEKIPVKSSPTKASTLAPHAAQDNDFGHRSAVLVSNAETIKKTKNLPEIDRQVNPANKTQTAAGTVAKTVEVHLDASGEKTVGAFEETFTEPLSGMEFILVRGGCYQMGSNSTSFEGPVHEVCVDDFYLSKYEVTQRQWKILMGRDFSYFKGDGYPVERITWDDTQRFIRQLNNRSGAAYRLPTEAEWEYAARGGGGDMQYAGTSDEESLLRFAWYQVNSNWQTHMVGVKKPNSLGLHDMSGNVWEWCSDWYDGGYYANSLLNNPQGPNHGIYRVIRGGEWELPAGLSRTTYREAAKPNSRRSDIGFRLALTLSK